MEILRIFNWNPFRPVKCIGGKVYFGFYYWCCADGQITLQTPMQFKIKRDMGLF